MRTLLVAHYWYPYNNSGTMRWLQFSKYIDFDVLTTKVPVNSFVDKTLPESKAKTIRFGNKLPAVIWGLIASFVVLFQRYDRYIITSPPESLLLGAYLLQLLGKDVTVDMRDTVDRSSQPIKPLIPFYRYLYNKLNNVVVCWRFMDESKPCVYHGYDKAHKATFRGYYSDRVGYHTYIDRLSRGLMPDQSNKPKGYCASSLHTFKKLGYPINNEFHEELNEVTPKSWKTRANEMKKLL